MRFSGFAICHLPFAIFEQDGNPSERSSRLPSLRNKARNRKRHQQRLIGSLFSLKPDLLTGAVKARQELPICSKTIREPARQSEFTGSLQKSQAKFPCHQIGQYRNPSPGQRSPSGNTLPRCVQPTREKPSGNPPCSLWQNH